MFIDAPHSVARAFLAMRELETFIPRYVEVVMKTVAVMHNSAERLKIDDKESRDAVLGKLITEINTFVLGDDPDNVKAWPLVTISPLHTGLVFRSQLIYLLSRDEVDIHTILNFINVVYFPTLNLTMVNENILRCGKYCDPNSKQTHRLVLLLAHQVAQQAARQELILPGENNDGEPEGDEAEACVEDNTTNEGEL